MLFDVIENFDCEYFTCFIYFHHKLKVADFLRSRMYGAHQETLDAIKQKLYFYD